MLYYILLIVSLTSLFYEITSLLYKIPDVRVEKKIKRLQRKGKVKKEFSEDALVIRFFVPLFRFFFAKVKGFRFNEFKMKADLEKVGIKDTPEVYLAKGLMYSFVSGVIGFVFGMLTGAKMFLFLGATCAIIFPFYPKSSLREKVKKLNDELLKEFPNFVSTLRYQYGKGKTLNDIVQSYMEVSGPALKYELQKLSAELEMMSDNEALLRFGDRIGLPDVSNFASSLVYGQMYGMDINSIFAIQEQEMRRLTRDNIMKLMKRKPVLMTVILMLPMINILLIVGVPPIVMLIKNFSKF